MVAFFFYKTELWNEHVSGIAKITLNCFLFVCVFFQLQWLLFILWGTEDEQQQVRVKPNKFCLNIYGYR